MQLPWLQSISTKPGNQKRRGAWDQTGKEVGDRGERQGTQGQRIVGRGALGTGREGRATSIPTDCCEALLSGFSISALGTCRSRPGLDNPGRGLHPASPKDTDRKSLLPHPLDPPVADLGQQHGLEGGGYAFSPLWAQSSLLGLGPFSVSQARESDPSLQFSSSPLPVLTPSGWRVGGGCPCHISELNIPQQFAHVATLLVT